MERYRCVIFDSIIRTVQRIKEDEQKVEEGIAYIEFALEALKKDYGIVAEKMESNEEDAKTLEKAYNTEKTKVAEDGRSKAD